MWAAMAICVSWWSQACLDGFSLLTWPSSDFFPHRLAHFLCCIVNRFLHPQPFNCMLFLFLSLDFMWFLSKDLVCPSCPPAVGRSESCPLSSLSSAPIESCIFRSNSLLRSNSSNLASNLPSSLTRCCGLLITLPYLKNRRKLPWPLDLGTLALAQVMLLCSESARMDPAP